MRKVLVIGPGTTGGIAAVIEDCLQPDFVSRWKIERLCSYEGPGLLTQLRVMAVAGGRLLGWLLARRLVIVHAHSASRGSFWRKSVLCALADLFGIPYVFHVHSGEFGVFYDSECGPAAKWWVRRTLRRAASVIALTEAWSKVLLVIEPRASIRVIGNPVAVHDALPEERESGRPEVLFLGRLREKKGVFDLVRAIPVVLKRVPDTVFTLAGDGEMEAVRRLAVDLGVSDAIKLPGWIKDAEKDAELSAARVLALPSYFEGLPVCILEAMAGGVPVVATSVGGIPELLADGECGLLVPPGDVEALAEALVLVLQDAALRRRLRESAFRRVLNYYAIPSVLCQLDAVYRSILANRPAAGG
ncbi:MULTISPECIES: glycosyltransferase family 4 protein [Methylococcus]|uniref:Glycosyltransferase family 4 protein n=1 Tax=Methylococcus capsulatus TaxID=414 RepID=A0ABZ2F9L3_METCP|nr:MULTISPECIES: glycosyltransferase family 4 protein [Methylococcus]MDF9392753.1 glycosyltransferase family 1 protein [Methylococcus capsulatus]